MPDPATSGAATLKIAHAVKAAKWAWDHQDVIEPKLKRFYRATKRKIFGRGPGILVLGAGGVGKTTLGRILSGKYDFLLDSDTEYEQSVGVQTFRAKKTPDVELVVAPGQEDRRDATWPSLLGSIANGKELGIVLCCADGHHALSSTYKYHKLYKSEPSSFLDRFLADRRQEEVRILKQVAASLLQNARPTWLLTLVGKEDLWTANEQQVHEFYRHGPYGKAIDELMVKKGTRLFRHELVFGSLIVRNFTTGRREILKKNTAGYDHVRQVESLRRIFETIASLEDWKVQ